MSGDPSMSPEEDPRSADERSRGGGIRPIGDVLAELLAHYRIRFPDINVTVVEQPSIVE